MKNNNFEPNILLVLTCLILCCLSCKKELKLNRNLIKLHPLKETVLISSLDDFVDEVQIIQIPSDQNILLSDVQKMLIGDSSSIFIYDYESNLVSLDKNGKLKSIASKGKGVKEHQRIDDIALSTNRSELMVLSGNRILCYGVSEDIYRRIDLDKVKLPVDAIAPSSDLGVFVYGAYPLDPSRHKKADPLVNQLTEDGVVINEFVKRSDFTISLFNVTQTRNNEYLLRPQGGNHLVYRFSKDTCSVAYQIDFDDKNIPERYYYEKANEDISKLMTSSYYKFPAYFHETNDILYFKASDSKVEHSFVYSLKSHRGIRWPDDVTGNSKLKVLACDSDYLYLIVYPDLFVSENLNQDVGILQQFIINTVKHQNIKIKITDNPIIIKLKFNYKKL